MSLGGDVEQVIRQLAHLHDPVVRGGAGKRETMLRQRRTVVVVYLVAVSVALGNIVRAVELLGKGADLVVVDFASTQG